MVGQVGKEKKGGGYYYFLEGGDDDPLPNVCGGGGSCRCFTRIMILSAWFSSFVFFSLLGLGRGLFCGSLGGVECTGRVLFWFGLGGFL